MVVDGQMGVEGHEEADESPCLAPSLRMTASPSSFVSIAGDVLDLDLPAAMHDSGRSSMPSIRMTHICAESLKYRERERRAEQC